MKMNLTLAKEGSSFIYEVVGLNELHDMFTIIFNFILVLATSF